MALTKARTGHRALAFVLSMGLENWFDTMDIDNLERIVEHLGLDSCAHALRNYKRLTRLLYVDGEPTDVWLEGANIVGIPQGCGLPAMQPGILCMA